HRRQVDDVQGSNGSVIGYFRRTAMTPRELWQDKCAAARGVKENFGTENALKYLIDEKFLDFLDAAERHKDWQNELPAFAAEIKDIFEQWEIADYLERARHREPFDPADYEDEGD